MFARSRVLGGDGVEAIIIAEMQRKSSGVVHINGSDPWWRVLKLSAKRAQYRIITALVHHGLVVLRHVAIIKIAVANYHTTVLGNPPRTLDLHCPIIDSFHPAIARRNLLWFPELQKKHVRRATDMSQAQAGQRPQGMLNYFFHAVVFWRHVKFYRVLAESKDGGDCLGSAPQCEGLFERKKLNVAPFFNALQFIHGLS